MRRIVLPVLSAVALLLATLSPAASADYPTSPLGDPVGANDWSCRPTAERPSPVVIVHGTFGDRRSLLDRLSYVLKRDGFCVFSLDYGNRATGPVEESAAQLSAYVDRVLEATGAARVSMVGHSQGGMMPRYYIRFLGGADKVDDLVGLAPSNHGTTIVGGMPGPSFCPACAQQAAGSEFLAHLNAGDETPGEVSYTQITTRLDEVVVPHTSGYLTGDNATNVTIQDLCRLDLAEHVLLPLDGPTLRVALHALTRPGPADPAYRPSCLP
jgi:triacylglycerol esterase/lipase EstA (alpha/beta hydrolase family)